MPKFIDAGDSTAMQFPERGQFPIVGIGASAGGLEAFIELLRNLPPSPGLALVLVQHLDPHHESLLSEILARETLLPVMQATDGLRVKCDHVYVIPPNVSMVINQGVLSLRPRQTADIPFMPIDVFLRSLADDLGSRSACAILSGGGTDGTIGLEAIKGADGITFVQEEQSARQLGMPRSAIVSGYADFVLPPEKIAQELVRVSRRIQSAEDKAATQPASIEADGLRKIFALLRTAVGADFSQSPPQFTAALRTD